MGFLEKQAYKMVQSSSDMGLTINELKTQLLQANPTMQSLNNTQLTQVLKSLEKKGEIKTVKGQQYNRKKVFMRADVEPNSEVTGGAISSGAGAIEIIAILMDKVYDFVVR